MPAFPDVSKVKYDGPDSKDPLAFRHYNPDELVEGKPMRDLYGQYLAASDAGEQKRLKKASLKLWQDFAKAQGKLNGTLPVPDEVKASAFSSQFFELWAQPAVILPDA